jgi:phosphoglycolate phosphatase
MAHDLISFDLDGTLVDTASEIAEAVNRALAAHGIARRAPAEITRLIGGGTRELMLKLLARMGMGQPSLAERVQPDAILASLDDHYARIIGTAAVPYDGCREALSQLRGAGVRLACVTNKESRHARRVLEATALDEFFDLTIGGDSLPERKPHASVLRHVVASLGGSAARTAHVGDSAIDVDAARNAGVTAWAVSYGYDAGGSIVDAMPERTFRNLSELAGHVLLGRVDPGLESIATRQGRPQFIDPPFREQ